MNRPRVPAELVARPRLYDILDRRRSLTLVVAPAGYGKSTLVSSWLERRDLPYAWLALDAGDSALNVFVEYLLAASERIVPGIRQRLSTQMQRTAALSYASMAHLLADELDAVDESFVLVLDDYHLVSEPATHRFLVELLRYPPRALNLVITSRVEPPLQVAVMRVNDHLTELRAHDLRFTTAEMATYLQRTLERSVDDRSLSILAETTEGWIAGLHLAALYLRNQEDIASAALRFRGNSRNTLDYLAVEVLARQEADVQDFLVKTSVLERMCPALCDAVLGEARAGSHSESILEQLESNNLFLVTLDDAQRWYRYHQLFQQLLEHRLRLTHTAEEIAGLKRRASQWCVRAGLVDEAIKYAIAAGDVADAIALVETNRHDALNAERWQQLEPWLTALPRREVNAHPELLVLEAWIMHKRERLGEIPTRLDLAEALLHAGNLPPAVAARLQSEIDVLRSQIYYVRADATRARDLAQRALEDAPPEHAGVRSVAWFHLAVSVGLAEGLPAALALLAEASRREPRAHATVRAKLLIARCFLFWTGADMPSLLQSADELLWLSAENDLPESLVWAHYFRGCASYQQDNLTSAVESFLAVMNYRTTASSYAFVHGAFGLAASLQAQGDPDGARPVIDMVLEYVQDGAGGSAAEVVNAFEARLALAQGQPKEALRWAANADRAVRPRPMIGFYEATLVVTAILAAHGTPAALHEAELLLRQLAGMLVAMHNRLFHVETLVQMALLHARRNQPADALAALGEAVTLAQPGDVRRIFLDAGPELDPWLDQLAADRLHRDFVARLRRSGQRHAEPAQHRVKPGPPPSRVLAQPRHPDLIELLTNREMEVLQLLAIRLTNKEIAQSLGISTETVKQHAMNIFRKLHVENRREAIVQARAMGFQLDGPPAL